RRVIGICSRAQVRGLLSGRYGFALYHRALIRDHLRPRSVIVMVGTPLREVLERALSRDSAEFYDDVVLVDSDQSFVGLISTHRLVQAQSTLVERQFDELAAQRLDLERSNERLSAAFTRQQELERQIIQKEKTALVQTLAGGVAHELNNKLMPVMGYAELL